MANSKHEWAALSAACECLREGIRSTDLKKRGLARVMIKALAEFVIDLEEAEEAKRNQLQKKTD